MHLSPTNKVSRDALSAMVKLAEEMWRVYGGIFSGLVGSFLMSRVAQMVENSALKRHHTPHNHTGTPHTTHYTPHNHTTTQPHNHTPHTTQPHNHTTTQPHHTHNRPRPPAPIPQPVHTTHEHASSTHTRTTTQQVQTLNCLINCPPSGN